MCLMYCSSFLSDFGYTTVLIMKFQTEAQIFITPLDVMSSREFYLFLSKDLYNLAQKAPPDSDLKLH